MWNGATCEYCNRKQCTVCRKSNYGAKMNLDENDG